MNKTTGACVHLGFFRLASRIEFETAESRYFALCLPNNGTTTIK
jgi:hypothetical protein